MFDLNESLSRWRTNMIQGQVYSDKTLDELEDHLRESMVELQANGLSEEEAFWLGTHRLGDAQSLGKEFTMADPGSVWRHHISWLVVGVLSFLIITQFSIFFEKMVEAALIWFNPSNTPLAAICGFLTKIFILGFLFFIFFKANYRQWLKNRLSPVLQKSSRKVVFLAIFILIICSFLALLSQRVINPFIYSIEGVDLYNLQLCTNKIHIAWTLLLPLILLVLAFKLFDRKQEPE